MVIKMNNTEERIKLIEAVIAERVEDYGDYELARIDSDDAYWLISVIRDLQKQIEELKIEKKYWINSHKNHKKAMDALREIAIYGRRV